MTFSFETCIIAIFIKKKKKKKQNKMQIRKDEDSFFVFDETLLTNVYEWNTIKVSDVNDWMLCMLCPIVYDCAMEEDIFVGKSICFVSNIYIDFTHSCIVYSAERQM